MNSDYVGRALCFHGPPMQKIWIDERGENDLQKLGFQHPSYAIYQERQKYFTFQDRAKRLKLHQFITRKASDLYSSDLRPRGLLIKDEHIELAKKNVATLPPYEIFIKKQDKVKRRQIALAELKEGDIIYGDIKESNLRMLTIRPLCTAEPLIRFMADLNIKATIFAANFGATPTDASGKSKPFVNNDYVCCEVHSVSLDAGRIHLKMLQGPKTNTNVQLGLIQYEDLPAYYRKVTESTGRYTDCLLNAQEFENPNYDDLFKVNGLHVNDTYSLIDTLMYEFPRQEYSKELRQTQAGKWAIRSVAEGIERFKLGQHLEAFQYLNKALNIDPHNVEGLVARGALYANKGSFLKAVTDFERALKINVYHGNARKYLGETLVALGRSYEEEQRLEDAAKAYQDCLNIIPKHEQACVCLNAVNIRLSNAGLQPFDNMVQMPTGEQHIKEQTSSTCPPINNKERILSSSSSDDDSSSGESSSDREIPDNKTNREQLSPLSQRLALQSDLISDSAPPPPEYNRPFFASESSAGAAQYANEFQLDDDDTNARVRKLLQAASKHKKAKKKSKKKKNKKAKKSTRDVADNVAEQLLKNINFEAAFKAIGGLQFESKLTENLQMYEQTIAEIKKRHEQRPEREGSETPPPPPSMTLPEEQPTTSKMAAYVNSAVSHNKIKQQPQQQITKLSFQIKRPVRMDKFGLLRVATPLARRSSTRSRSKSPRSRGDLKRRSSKSRSRSFERNRYRARDSRSRNGARSRSRSRKRHARSRSRSQSIKRARSRSRHRSRSRRGRERSPSNSPYRSRQRDSVSPRRHHRIRSRSRDYDDKRRGMSGYRGRGSRGSRPPSKRTPWRPNFKPQSNTHDRWKHDKFNINDSSDDSDIDKFKKIDDGPSIEEIDEIIKEAQKERKQAIIQSNKDILKKSYK